MSVSQKHLGLILVPWFNKEEWNYVCECVLSPDPELNEKALEIIKIWKLRTPILSTGIEGTLIILDALSSESTNKQQLQFIYSVGIMRFLNLSAANSEKQGEFTKMSNKIDLPEWLINLRHDIAHGHNLPSLAMLTKGLKFGLDWVREKYWEPKNEIIKDYFLTDYTYSNDALVDALNIYVHLKLNMLQLNNQNLVYLKRAKEMIYKITRKRLVDVKMMTDILEEVIKQSLETDQNKLDNEKVILGSLVTQQALLNSIGIDNTDLSIINKDFLNLWQSLLNILHEQKLIIKLVHSLLSVTDNIEHSDSLCKFAALWVKEILKALLELQEANNGEIQSIEEIDQEIERGNTDTNISDILLKPHGELYKEETNDLQIWVLNHPNKYSKTFLEVLFQINGNTSDLNYIKSIIDLKTNERPPNTDVQSFHENVFNLEDLQITINSEDEINNISNQLNNESKVSHEIPIVGNQWIKVKDIFNYKNCPLGVLPHQINLKHPHLEI